MPLLMGVDLGTSATKAVFIGDGGDVIATASAEHSTSQPRPGWSEQSPDAWWESACTAIRHGIADAGIDAAEVRGVGLSGQMHGSVFLPEDATADAPNVIRPAILWNDQRTEMQCRHIEETVGRMTLLRTTGNVALTGFTAPKILWLKEHEPDHFKRLATVLLPKDYLAFRLTGEQATDVGDGSGTLLFDLEYREFHEGIMQALGLPTTLFPKARGSSEQIGTICASAAEATGLTPGTPVVIGSGDQMTGAVGAGVVTTGRVSATFGTSGVIFAHSGRDRPNDPQGKLQIMCAGVPQEYCMYGCMLAAAGALQWFRDVAAPTTEFADLDSAAANAPPGASGLLFLPYLSGERCPHPDPSARGAFIGLTSAHDRGHLARAVMEGVACGMAQMLDLTRRLGVRPVEIRMLGGGAKSGLWRQIFADLTGLPVVTLATAEGSAFGAAILAGVGVEVWSSVADACSECVTIADRIEPDPATVEQYGRVRALYDAQYERLRTTFAQLRVIEESAGSDQK